MYPTATRLLGVALVLLWSVTLVGCDDEISSVEDLDIQSLADFDASELTVLAGNPSEPTQFDVTYQGLDTAPELTTSSDQLQVEVAEEEGDLETGTTTWDVLYTGSVDGSGLSESLTLSVQGDAENLEETIPVQVQNPLRTSQEAFTFVAGQSPQPSITVDYEGIESAPVLEADGAPVDIELVTDEGDPQDGGSRTWLLEYAEPIDGDSVTEVLQLVSESGSASYSRAIEVQFNNAITVSSDFSSEFISVEDFETEFSVPEVEDQGATTSSIEQAAAENSIGLNALEIDAAAGDPVTLVREASLPDLNVLSFLVRPDPNDEINLTLILEEEVDGEIVEREVGLLIEPGSEWVQYEVALDALLEDFNPVAERADGNGPLQSISFITGSDVSYAIDDVMMGTTDGPQAEINDFEVTNSAYGSFSDIELDFSEVVEEGSPGFTSRSFSYTEGGNFFGYNFNNNGADIFFANAENGDLVLSMGQVSEDFGLYTFVETPEGAGGYNFDAGQTVEIEASDGWQEVRIPLSELGDDPSALLDSGIGNIGFELRREDEDAEEPLELLIDDIRLDATGN